MGIYFKHNNSVLSHFKTGSIFDDTVFDLGDICRIFEFGNISTKHTFLKLKGKLFDDLGLYRKNVFWESTKCKKRCFTLDFCMKLYLYKKIMKIKSTQARESL